jgi:hypothetical protein
MNGIADSKIFILLSKIAKEKKYAQEYLGLLARRGDLGSIRIGKRWYTTAEWFESFLVDTEKRKEEMRVQMMKQEAKEKKEAAAISSEIKKEVGAVGIKVPDVNIIEKLVEEVKVVPVLSVPTISVKEPAAELSQDIKKVVEVTASPEIKISEEKKEEVPVLVKTAEPKINISIQKQVERPMIRERSEFVPVSIPKIQHANAIAQSRPRSFVPASNSVKIDLRRIESRRRNFVASPEPRILERKQPSDPFIQVKSERELYPAKENPFFELESRKRIIFENSDHAFPPNSTNKFGSLFLFFQKLAFSLALVLLFAVLSVGVFQYRKDSANFPKLGGGAVAGAQDTRLAGVSSLENFTASYFEARRGQTKENVSLSRVILEAALEKNQQK